MAVSRCLKQVSDALSKNDTESVRHFVRHLSDTWSFFNYKTVTCGCLTKCLMVSVICSNVTVCLRGVFLEPPRPDTQTPSGNLGVVL